MDLLAGIGGGLLSGLFGGGGGGGGITNVANSSSSAVVQIGSSQPIDTKVVAIIAGAGFLGLLAFLMLRK